MFEKLAEKEKKDLNHVAEVLTKAEQLKQESKKLTSMEKQTISERISSMSEEEQILVLEKIPMDLIFRHIGNVLEKNRKFIQGINEAMDILK